MPGSLIEIEGFPELAKALAQTGPEVRRALRDRLKDLAEPIAHDAEFFAIENISGIQRQRRKHWERMRVGISRGFSLTYVAPRERGVKTRGPDTRRRPGFADTLRDEAMAPAVEKNRGRLVNGAAEIVDDVTNKWWL